MASKKEYLISELWILVWGASVQRANLYNKNTTKAERDKFRIKVITYVSENIIPTYKKPVGEKEHCQNIVKVINYANQIDMGILGKNGYKYGVAQKMLNLALKYYWCLGEIKEPPHCPVDRIVIDKTIYRNKINWTEILTEEDYLKVIEAVRNLAKGKEYSIPLWELGIYNRRQP